MYMKIFYLHEKLLGFFHLLLSLSFISYPSLFAPMHTLACLYTNLSHHIGVPVTYTCVLWCISWTAIINFATFSYCALLDPQFFIYGTLALVTLRSLSLTTQRLKRKQFQRNSGQVPSTNLINLSINPTYPTETHLSVSLPSQGCSLNHKQNSLSEHLILKSPCSITPTLISLLVLLFRCLEEDVRCAVTGSFLYTQYTTEC